MSDSLHRLLQKARTAPPPAVPDAEPLPPGAATRIAARWAAARPAIVLWERLSYAGLAASVVVSACSFGMRPRSHAESVALPAGEISLADLMDAPFDPSPGL